MNDDPTPMPAADDDDYARQLREINETLLVSSVRQHELTEEAEKAQAALRQSEARLAKELVATQRLHEISTQLIHEESVTALQQQILDAGVAIMGADMASLQVVDESTDALRLLAWRGFGADFSKIFELVGPDRKTCCSAARQVGRRVIVPDVETCELFVGTSALDDHLSVGIRALQSTPLISRRGQILGVISTHWRQAHEPSDNELRLFDVLARQAADLIERSRAEHALREANRRKDEFMALLGHELRNPLGIISTSVQILRRIVPAGSQADHWQNIIERQVIHTSQMLDDLLDISRISLGKIQLHKERCDFGDIVRQTVDDHRETLQNNGLQLDLQIADRALPIIGDRTRLAQVVGNLLQNAVKFTDNGGTVTVNLVTDALGTKAVLSVVDTGAGMEVATLGWVFEPFRQADRTLDHSRGGLGLGLALVKGIVQLHGGHVTVSSAGLGRGSTFVVQLPLDITEPLSVGAPIQEDIKSDSYRLLIIEDNKVAAETIRRLLEMSGHTVEIAFSGPEGVEAARRFQPEVVLCDIGLPGLDGYRVAEALRLEVGLRDALLIAMSGYAEDARRARDSGFNEYVLKPISFDKLLEIIKSNMTHRGVAN